MWQRFSSVFVTQWDYLLHTKNGRLFLTALTVALATGIGLLLYIMANTQYPSTNSVPLITKPEPIYSPLTGVELEDEKLAERPVTAVILENSPDARPQSGLKEAGVIYEAVAEAGITRFLTLYQEDQPKLIGPVRSVRPYYVEWASAYDPAVAHVGGSAKALKMIRSGDYGVDLDQFFNAGAYWRVNDRTAPHNVYTDSKHLNKLLDQKNKTSSEFTGFLRQDEKPLEEPKASRIDIGVSSGDYAVSYRYDKKANTYTRSQGGEAHRDREKGTITPKIVVAIKVSSEAGFEDGYREIIKTTGKGEAFIFQNGNVQKVTWQRKNRTSPLQFVNRDGEEVALNRGQTWITALDTDREVAWR